MNGKGEALVRDRARRCHREVRKHLGSSARQKDRLQVPLRARIEWDAERGHSSGAAKNADGACPPLRRGKSRHVASVCLVLLRSSTACANAIRKGVAAMPTESERQFLKALAASPIPSGIPELRK